MGNSVQGGPSRPTSVIFPSQEPGGEPTEVESESGVIVIVGANGSGKSRLGAWIETSRRNEGPTHRVSAQKILRFPSDVRGLSSTEAKNTLLYGFTDVEQHRDNTRRLIQNKIGSRWSSNPVLHVLDDFQRLLTYLFSEHHELTSQYAIDATATRERLDPPVSVLMKVVEIWQAAMGQRQLRIRGYEIHAKANESTETYNARELSDGERVTFYLIGECLAAEPGSIVVIDEPEIHLHRSVQSRLWDAVQAERQDCLFVYFTHDLEFAASRHGATKIVLTGYEGNDSWEWKQLPDQDTFPEDVWLEIAGSRKPILFVEGERDSWDYLIYSHAYPGFTIVPMASCGDVIRATSTLNNSPELHRYKCRGIIDRDQRTKEEIASLQNQKISVLDFAEIENVLLDPGVIRAVGHQLEITDLDGLEREVRKTVLDRLKNDQDETILAIATARLTRMVRDFSAQPKTEVAFAQSVNDLDSELQSQTFLDDARQVIEGLLANDDYRGALRVYRNKDLIRQVAGCFEFRRNRYAEYVAACIRKRGDNEVLAAVRAVLPTIEVPSQTTSQVSTQAQVDANEGNS